LPPAKPSKTLDPAGYFDLHNPQLQLLDSDRAGVSIKKLLDVLNIKAKENQAIPAATQAITEVLDAILTRWICASRAIDRGFEK
jgi:hypothetical protein